MGLLGTNRSIADVLAAVIGAGFGYLVWLVGTMVVLATTPVDYWVISEAVLLVVLTAASFLVAIRCKPTRMATVFWVAPVLPILVSAYLLIVVVT